MALATLAVLVCSVTGALSGLACSAPNEPRYQLRSASHWIEELGESNIPNEIWGRSNRNKAEQALRSIGAAAIPACLRALRDERWHVRVGAAQALRLYGREAGAAVPVLVEALEDRNGQVRSAAASTLWSLGSEAERAIPALIEGLKHPEPLTRITFAHALAGVVPGNEAAVATLIESLTYEDREFRAFIRERGRTWKAGEQAFSSASDRNGREIWNREHAVRAAAATALGELGPDAERAVPQLGALIREREHNDAVTAAVVALGRIGPGARAAVPALLEILHDMRLDYTEERAYTNQYALQHIGPALGQIGVSDSDVPHLIELLRHPGRNIQERWNSVARAAARAFAGAHEDAVQPLVELLRDQNPTTAERATWALASMGPRAEAAVPVLTLTLGHADPFVRRFAAVALGDIGRQPGVAVPALAQALKDGDSTVAVQAALALGKMGPRAAAATPALREALRHRDPYVRAYAAAALGEMGRDAEVAVPWLRELRNDEDESVRGSARKALEKLGLE